VKITKTARVAHSNDLLEFKHFFLAFGRFGFGFGSLPRARMEITTKNETKQI
jgi:hypothetical protein